MKSSETERKSSAAEVVSTAQRETWLQLYWFKGFPLTSMSTVRTRRAQSQTLQTGSVGSGPSNHGSTHKTKSISDRESLHFFTQDSLKWEKNDFLALFCLYEKNLTCSESHIFLRKSRFHRYVCVVPVGFNASKRMWDCRKGENYLNGMKYK